MPGLNGYETCQRIRAQNGGPGRTLVAVTGFGQPQDVQRAQSAGFDHHMVKPLEMQQLARLISERVAG